MKETINPNIGVMEKISIKDPDTGKKYLKTRYRCPECMRGLLVDRGMLFCTVHIDVEPVDLAEAIEKQIKEALFYSKVER